MTVLSAFWLPILLSAVAVFIVSSIIHMVLPWHKSDYPKVPNEEAVRSALGPLSILPGDYMVPRPSGRDEMKSAEFAEKVRVGPNVIMTVLPNGPWSMSRNLILWFLYLVVVGILVAALAGSALPRIPEHHEIIHFITVAAFMGYAVALWQNSIWYRRAWSFTIKATVDAVIYGFVTAMIFAWLWPQ